MMITDPILNLLETPNIFTDNQMLFVFFFYGLGFIILGTVTFLKKRELIDVDLTKAFYFLGGFGIVHGLTEWVDFGRIWIKIASNTQYPALNMLKVSLLAASFILLMQFGINMLTLRREKYRFLRWLPLIAAIGFFSYALITGTLAGSELIARYGFGFTGSLLTTIALLEIRKVSSKKLTALRRGATLMLIAFGVYTVFGGLITKPILGFPPQIIRALCALLAGYASSDLLTVLETGLGKEKEKAEKWN